MATTVIQHVCKAMERIAPLRLAEKWDNVGLLLEPSFQRPNANRVLLTIDLTPSVLAESISKNALCIVSYHPAIFKPISSFTMKNPLQASLLRCAERGIFVYSPHTALDSVWGGVNDWLADGVMGDEKRSGQSQALLGEKRSPTNESEGAEGRLVTLDEAVDISVLEIRIKKLLGLAHLEAGYATPTGTRPTTPVRTIAICAGSGGSMLLGTPADVYFTGEMSHHEVLAAVASGKHVILCGHTNTERGYLHILASKLRLELQRGRDLENHVGLQELEVLVSESDRHPLLLV